MKTKLTLTMVFAVLTLCSRTYAADGKVTKNDLRKLFENTEWSTNEKEKAGDPSRSFVFRRDGELVDSHPGGGKYMHYTLETPDILKIYHGNPDKNRKADYMLFHVNVEAKTAEQDTAASTLGGSMKLKFEGAAKPGK